MSIADGKYVITQEGCPHCVTFKEENGNLFEEGFKETNLSKLEKDSPWWELVQKLDISGTPSIVSVEGDEICEINSDDSNGSGGKCVNLGSKAPEPQIKEPAQMSMNDYISQKINS